MVKLLEADQVDTLNEEVDAAMTADEEAAARRQFAATENPGDLSDGGMINGARLSPMQNGKRIGTGRAAARRAWMWNGTETVLPLAWNPDGTIHDGARRYLLKRHCLCCQASGFRGLQCPSCVKKRCPYCRASTDRKKVIPCFYLRKEDVPFPTQFHGSIPCFLPSCVRTGERGFLTEEEMRMHAESRHTRQYRVHLQVETAKKASQVETLQKLVDELLARGLGAQPMATQAASVAETARRKKRTYPEWTPERRKAASEAAKKRKVAVGAT